MATLVFAAAGAAVGSSIGGTLLGVSAASIGMGLGQFAGSMIDSTLFGSKTKLPDVVGQRLETLKVQISTYGKTIPHIYGYNRLAGNVIWALDIKEKEVRSTVSGGGGKGGGGGGVSQTSISYEYFATLAIAICEGEVDEIIRVWADARQLTADDLQSALGQYEIFTGSETQGASAIIERYEGAGNAPAYRSTAYVVLEDFPLAAYGNRIPNFTFEVRRKLQFSPSVEEKVKSIMMIPGSGEFVYSRDIVEKYKVVADENNVLHQTGEKTAVNLHNFQGKANVDVAVDQLLDSFPNLEWVGLVVSWFATSKDAGSAEIFPKVEYHETQATTTPVEWSVAGYTRNNAELVLTFGDGALTYGGTPTDKSIIDLCVNLKSRGLNVMLYPLLQVDTTTDIPGEDNKPWRGRITPSSSAEVTDFFTRTNGYNRFIRHYAQLQVGGVYLKDNVDAFIIGSEMVGLTQYDSGGNTYPAVAQFKTLAANVQSDLGGAPLVGYAADWSEYHSVGGYYNMDSLWTDSNIDFVGIDAYYPITPDLPQSQITEEKIIEYWEKGEGWDYYYEDSINRNSSLVNNPISTTDTSATVTLDLTGFFNHNLTVGQTFTLSGITGNPGGISNANINGLRSVLSVVDDTHITFTAGAAATSTVTAGGSAGKIDKPKYFDGATYAWKNVENWWNSSHTNPGGGATGWTAKLKPVWFTEYGFPSVDGCANQPNVFYDPRSIESYFPRASRGRIDLQAQREAVNATEDYLTARNAVSGNANLVPRSFLWTWDARPFPFFPDLRSVWADYNLWPYGHWVSGKFGNSTLGAIVAELLQRVGLTGADYDVTRLTNGVEGFIIDSQTTCREALELLKMAYFFDMVESEGILKFIPRGGESSVSIAEDKLLPTGSGKVREHIEITRTQELDMPNRVTVSYISRTHEYQTNTQFSQRQTVRAKEHITISFPIAMSDQEGKQIADITLYNSWISRMGFTFRLPPEFAATDPGDVITVTVNSVAYVMRVISASMERNGSQQITAVAEDVSTYDFYTPPGESPQGEGQGVIIPQTDLYLLDLPAFPIDTGNEGVMRAAMVALGDAWEGASLFRSLDGGASGGNNFNSIASTDTKTIKGIVLNTLPAWSGGNVFDTTNTIDVALIIGSLSSTNELALLNGANACVVNNEIIQFQNATLTGERRYRLSKLLRGRLGTEHETSGHAPGDTLIMIDSSLIEIAMPPASVGVQRFYKAVTLGDTLANTTEDAFTYTGKTLRPYSPVHIEGARDGGGNLTVTWVRRTRISGEWRDHVDVPLGEESERYEVDIMDGLDVVRTITGLTSPTASYTAAEQTTDFGAPQSSIDIRIYQISVLFGRGVAGQASL
jgi:hypothetical protein